MKYITVMDGGGFELRQDACEVIPIEAIQITDEQYDGLLTGALIFVNGEVMPK